MKIIRWSVFLLSIAVAFSVVSVSGEKKKMPEGVELKTHDHAVAQRGYEFYRVSDREVGVRQKSGKVVEGRLWCTCTEGEANAECVIRQVDKNTVKCQEHGGCRKCEVSLRPVHIAPR